ncbi:MAG TPA: outer membrane beta-barrel protein [Verrucomicrobiae bacterium]|nr:outer membrane beta-barrel protein [Verrucomicrobiae bacterium]
MEQERATLSLKPGSAQYLDPNSFLRWGPVTARPHFDSSFSYSTGLRSQAGVAEKVVSERISPGILLEIGPKWRLDYTPSLTFYSSKNFKDTLDHSVLFAGGTTYNDWAFTLSQGYTSSSQSLIETGRQTDQENFDTAIGASHYLNSKLMLQLGVNQSFRSADSLNSSRSWSTMDWLNYQIAPRFSIGAGLGGGFEDVKTGSDMTYEMVQGRVDARIAEKLNLSIHAGGELRQILESDADPLLNPIYGASLIYHPFTQTTLSLAGNRTVSASLLFGQVTESTDISVGLTQRLFGAVSAGLSAGFRNTRFLFTTAGTSLSREDDSFTFAGSLGYTFLKRGSIGVSYAQSENSSSDQSFSQTTRQVSLNLGYRF